MLDPSGPFTVAERDVVYARPDGLELVVRLYDPVEAPRPRPVLVEIHGGAWSSGDRTLGAPYNRAVAACGALVAAPEFRDGRNAAHPSAAADVAAAVRWVRANAAELGADPARVALAGSSSGGHLALYTALRPGLTALGATPIETPQGLRAAPELGAGVGWVGAFWPPADPLARYRYAQGEIGKPVPEGQQFSAKGLVKFTEAYFGNEAAMGEASIARIVAAGEAEALPAVWLVQAGADLNVPASILDELEAAYRAAGGALERTFYEGEVHGFGRGDTPGAERFRADLVARVVKALG
ncbi:MAG: alpha/beta hydrolase [Acidimicrobiales bacterium]